MAITGSRDLSQTRSLPGLQHRLLQFRRWLEGISSQSVATKHIIGMKLSTEAIVALTVAVVFALLSIGAIAREQGQAPAHNGHKAYIAASNISVVASHADVLGLY